jgi:two-component system cell cycle response regulator DivK
MVSPDTTLIIDDNCDASRLIAILLNQFGEAATRKDSGQEALQYLKTHIPRLILLDVVMPDMSGIDVLHEIRKDARLAGVPVILFSSAPQEPGFDDMAKKEGAVEFWVKSDILFNNLQQLLSPYLASVTVFSGYYPTPLRVRKDNSRRFMN